MKRMMFLLLSTAVLANSPAFAAGKKPLSPQLEKLNISVGRWVYHGMTLKTKSGKAGSWTWNADCRWSPKRVFLECSFNNDWSGKKVVSLVVDTYNTHDHSYWHYEMFATGAGGEHPFVSRMTIKGDTWTEYAQDVEHGKKISTRIIYRYTSPTRVSVAIETSDDGVHWVTVDRGEGVKLK